MINEIAIWRIGSSTEDPLEQKWLRPTPVTLDAATQMLPGGGYTTFRTFGRFRVLRLEDHFNRLEETARLAGNSIVLDRERIHKSLHQAVAGYPAEDMRVRMILDLEFQVGDIYILIDTLHTPELHDYKYGVKAVTRRLQRENPKAKLTGFIITAAAVRHNLPEGVDEAIMVGEDCRVLEGLSSNFFGVKGGTIWTAERGVLSGITRSFVLNVIRILGIPLRLEGVLFEEISDLEEAFITSASRAVLPVTEIDGTKIGSGMPGKITQMLMKGYHDRLEEELNVV